MAHWRKRNRTGKEFKAHLNRLVACVSWFASESAKLQIF